MTFELPDDGDCVFCAIVAGDRLASWEARPNGAAPDGGAPDGAATVACFHNKLKWERVMLLIVPTQHMTQKEFWSSHVLVDAALLAVEMGDKHCGDDGYRVISNFGRVAHQSQAHAHLHVVSGTSRLIREARKKSQKSRQKSQMPGMFDFAGGDSVRGGLVIDGYDVDGTPFAVEISVVPPATELSDLGPSSSLTQREFWGSDQILHASKAALQISERHSPEGFRLMSSFDPADPSGNNAVSAAGNNGASLFLLGGGQLSLYI